MDGVFMKKWCYFLIVISLLAMGTFSVAAAMQQEQKALADKLVRLHVVANSDSEEDQSMKLRVRDAVLEVTEPLVQRAKDPRQALASALPEIKSAAEDCLLENGSGDSVNVTLSKERFPTRYYDSFALPAGVYPSLRVTIGAGEGKNWWCVAFPSVCFCATAEELESAAVSAGFTQNEVRLITENEDEYILKFKLWELLGELKSRFFDE